MMCECDGVMIRRVLLVESQQRMEEFERFLESAMWEGIMSGDG